LRRFSIFIMVRQPAVAGRFYPAQRDELLRTVQDFLPPAQQRAKVTGIIVPHAGYMYSGRVAGAVYARVDIPNRNIVLCPNHTGFGVPLSIMQAGAWQTPLGQMQIDHELCTALMAVDPHLQDDAEAHRFEHALEVQLPFLQHLAGPSATFVPITIGTGSWHRLEELGGAIAEVCEARTFRCADTVRLR
jgi:MEMO1 family protein